MIENVNIFKQAKEWGIPIWQHPQFLFLIMGILIAATDIISYLISVRYIVDFAIIIVLICATTVFLFIITYIIQSSFERMAEATRMKTEFVSVVSHQLRTPVTNLNWALDYIKNSPVSQDKDFADYLRILKINTERMKDMVNNLLIVSRLDGNRLDLTKENSNLCKIVDSVMERSNNLALSKSVKFRKECAEQDLEIYTDPIYLGIVIENLVNNAIRYSREGGEVLIRIAREAGKICVYVKDSGVGIPEKDQKFIFQKFFRASNVRQSVPEGTGLGLFMSNMVAKKLACQMGFSSEEGRGTTFWLKIPIKK